VGLACLVAGVVVVTVPLARRPFVLGDVRGPRVDAVAAAIAPRPGERLVLDADPSNQGYLLWVAVVLAADGHDVRLRDAWRVQVTVEQAMPETWDRSIHLDTPGGRDPGRSWREIGSVTDASGREVQVLGRPAPAFALASAHVIGLGRRQGWAFSQ
jgi:hypothetical protein